jgi:chromosome segregation ATPase
MTNTGSSSIQVASAFAYLTLTPANVDVKESHSQNNPQSTTSSTEVNISHEARDKLAQQLQAEKVEEEKNESDTEFLDKMIDQIQGQIKEIKQELRKLNNDNAKEVQQEKKMLESQLSSLNGTLLSLYGKKIAALEESAP